MGSEQLREPKSLGQLDLVIHLVLQLLLAACLEFQKRAPLKRNDHAQKVSFPSSCCRIKTLLQPPSCLQWVLPRLGNIVIRLIIRVSHERCMHLLQDKLQVLYSSLLFRGRWQGFAIDEFCRDFRLFTCPLFFDHY